MAKILTANEVKTKGVKAFEIEDDEEAIISVHGRNKYVVMTIEQYNHLRECELEAALIESRQAIKNGDYIEESVQEHINRIENA